MKRLGLIAGVCLVVGLLWIGIRYALAPEILPGSTAYLDSLSGPINADFTQALAPRPFTFPEDHQAHDEFQTEWWYFTGNLRSADGRRWGYQLTFFRQALAPPDPTRTSEWASNTIYLAHFTLTDIDGKLFSSFEQLHRGGAVGLAGTTDSSMFINTWQLDWQADSFRLKAAKDDIAIAFDLSSLKPATLQGRDGLSAKSDVAGSASYYYSFTRLATSGTITIGATEVPVSGLSWFDHEWSTSALEEGQVGWQWYGLHLDDGRDLMWGQLRKDDGTVDYDFGSITPAEGSSAAPLMLDTAQLTVLDTWQSPTTGFVYPARWSLTIPAADIDIIITPLLADQELRLLSATYWEGAVEITGSVTGLGYVELTGYGRDGRQLR